MPTPTVSVVDLVVQVEKKTFAEEVNEAFREAANGPLKGILAVRCAPVNANGSDWGWLCSVQVPGRGSDCAWQGSWRQPICCCAQRGSHAPPPSPTLASAYVPRRSDEPLVSCDYRMTNVSSTIDAALTMVMGDDMVKVRGSSTRPSQGCFASCVHLVAPNWLVQWPAQQAGSCLGVAGPPHPPHHRLPLLTLPFPSSLLYPTGGGLVRQRVGLLPARGRPG